MDAVEQLSLAYWATYLLFFAVCSTLVHAAAWLDGTLPPFTLEPVFVLVPLRIVAPLLLMTYRTGWQSMPWPRFARCSTRNKTKPGCATS